MPEIVWKPEIRIRTKNLVRNGVADFYWGSLGCRNRSFSRNRSNLVRQALKVTYILEAPNGRFARNSLANRPYGSFQEVSYKFAILRLRDPWDLLFDRADPEFSKIASFDALGMVLVPDESPGFELSLFCNRVAPIIFLPWQISHSVELLWSRKFVFVFLFELFEPRYFIFRVRK